jgi:tRNA-specific 2-thiouridylase
MRVLAALSGGVDSSVAAAVMVAEGHEVIGVTLKLWQGPQGEVPTAGCCTVSDAEDARRVAAQLDIPYYVLDYTGDFRHGVVERFIGDYLDGRTPNPCVECNRTVKFSRLMSQAEEFGCDLLVTGHYARTNFSDGRWQLMRSKDRQKDQSYVLYMLGQQQLARVRFPVGDQDKAETRRHAAALGLRTAHKPESQDICFVGRDDYRNFLRRNAPAAISPGAIVDTAGQVVGRHEGIAGFTIGQRKGLGVAVGEPRFVVGLQPATSTVVLGNRNDLLVGRMEVGQVSWVGGDPPPMRPIQVKVRYHSDPIHAAIDVADEDGQVGVEFEEPQAAVAPGQAAVFYRGDEVLGGGTILSTSR